MKKTKKLVVSMLLVGTLGSSVGVYAAIPEQKTTNVVELTSVVSATKSGWVKQSGKWYYYEKGKAVTGWKEISKNWYFFNKNGIMQTGWTLISGNWYFLKNGIMQTGWMNNSGNWYYFNDNGIMQTGWTKISGNWYFFKDGIMQTGWTKISGNWYFLKYGIMQTGWKKISGNWYFLKNGIMQTGWMKNSGNWYYFNDNGIMQTGFQEIDKKWYCFYEDTGSLINEGVIVSEGQKKSYAYVCENGECLGYTDLDADGFGLIPKNPRYVGKDIKIDVIFVNASKNKNFYSTKKIHYTLMDSNKINVIAHGYFEKGLKMWNQYGDTVSYVPHAGTDNTGYHAKGELTFVYDAGCVTRINADLSKTTGFWEFYD